MNYFRARKYKKVFEDFKNLTYEYWDSLPEQPDTYGIDKFRYTESKESSAVRERITKLLPYVEEAATYLGIGYIAKSFPPPAVGGVVIPVNIYRSVIEPEQGYDVLDKNIIIDKINISQSMAEKQCKEELIHMLLPWNWVIDLCALIIRIPFIILRRAGLPPKVEENIIAHAIKIFATIILVSWLAYKGISLTGIDLIDLIKNFFK